MIDSDALNPLIEEAFTGRTTWLEASSRYPVPEFIETFFVIRERNLQALEKLTDVQAAYTSPAHPMWSISESVTHLIYTQGFYINKLLDISTSQLPHVVEAARGFGEGAHTGVAAHELRWRLAKATEQIRTAIESTRKTFNPEKIVSTDFFGVCNYNTWILLLLAHEVDHLRQVIAMRRLSRTEQG
jgi:hypothetical protein